VKRENDELNMLRKCLKEERVKFSYQPIIDRKTGGVEYYECLLRIENHHGEYVSIGSLIEKAEAKGLANIIDFTVIEMVTKELIRNPSLVLSVNISNMGLLNKALGNKIEQIFIEHKIAPRLIIEITETSLNHDFHNSKIFLDKLRKYGCKFALDDFGSGFTAFNQLLNLPIDIIKIDGTYIKNILDNKYNRYFVEALISMAGDLGIKTVAEYVENDAIAKFLIEAKIDSMQGHFFFPASEYKIGEISE
jgi:EAL domain-containing protein (putative c-di-GMP-specific phosphodiesterase class I)